MRGISLLLLLTLPAWAGDNLYKASAVSFVASSVADVASSYGSLEANPRMRSADGRLGKKGLIIKAIVTGGVIGVQALAKKLARDRKSKRQVRRVCTSVNFVLTGAQSAIAVRNVRLGK